MCSEGQLRDLLEQFLERTLEPRLRQQVEAGDIETQEDFEEALQPAVLLRGVIDEWESDVKSGLGYETMPPTCRDGKEYDPLTHEGRERWILELSAQLGVTREQLSKMDLDEIFQRIRGD